jgi:outer membrane protein assembly factor BamB
MACYDSQGNQLWNRDFEGTDSAYFGGVELTPEHDLIAAGQSKDDLTLARYDLDGTLKWSVDAASYFPDRARDFTSAFRAVSVLPDDTFIAVGEIIVQGGDFAGVAVHLTSDGKMLWAKEYEKNIDVATFDSAITSQDGNVLVSGWTEDYKGCVAKITPQGKVLWSNQEVQGVKEAYPLTGCSDGGCMAFCTLNNSDYTTLERYNANGKRLWEYTVKAQEIPYTQGLIEEPDHTFALYGGVKIGSTGETRDYIAHLDASGKLLSDMTPLSSDSEIYDAKLTSDGALIICGRLGATDTPNAFIAKLSLSQLQ